VCTMKRRKVLVWTGIIVAALVGTVATAALASPARVATVGTGPCLAAFETSELPQTALITLTSRVRLIDIVADLTGLSVSQIASERAAGASIADIAQSHGVPAEDVLAAALAARRSQLDELVVTGAITEVQAQTAYDQMAERLGERITATDLGRPAWAGGGNGACGAAGYSGTGSANGSERHRAGLTVATVPSS